MRLLSLGRQNSGARLLAPALLLLALACLMLIAADTQSSLAQSPFGAAARGNPETGFVGWVMAKQAIFYRALSGAVRAAKTDGSALWTLMGIAFAYGVFHAAGPGHGKAVISSYLLANDETWRRGLVLSFASALLQSLTAVLIVGIAAALLGATAKMMGDAARIIEIISYALIVLLGARLLWVKGIGFIRAAKEFLQDRRIVTGIAMTAHPRDDAQTQHVHAGQSDRLTPCAHAHSHQHDREHVHGHHHHRHGVDRDSELDVMPWGHAHGPEPEELGGPGGWRRGLSAIVAVGLRPCSGAIILLVFALSQGLFWAGIVSTFVMGLGTAITVAVIATAAVGAKAFVNRFAGSEMGLGGVVVRGMEVGAASLILAFGLLLLAGYMATERLTLF